jgi:hypothetical protein
MNARERKMSDLIDERLVNLNEIATDCFNVKPFALDAKRPEIHIAVKPANIVRALESAYDLGLIAGYQLTWAGMSRP